MDRLAVYTRAYPPNGGGPANQVKLITDAIPEAEVVLQDRRKKDVPESNKVIFSDSIIHPKRNCVFNGIDIAKIFHVSSAEWVAGPNILPLRFHFSARKYWMSQDNVRSEVGKMQLEEEFAKFNFKKIIALNDFQKNFYISIGVPKNKIVKIPIAIDIEKFPKRKEIPNKQKVGWMGYKGWVKGWKDVIEIAKLLPDVEFEMFSSNVIQVEELPPNVDILYRVPHEELYERIKEWSVYINTSRVENSCVAMQECMSTGIPVIASNVQGNPETASNQIVIEPGVENFVKELTKLLADKEKQKELGDAGAELIRKRNNIKVVADMFREAI